MKPISASKKAIFFYFFIFKAARKARSFPVYGQRDSMQWKANSLSQSVKYLNN